MTTNEFQMIADITSEKISGAILAVTLGTCIGTVLMVGIITICYKIKEAKINNENK